MKAKIFEYPIVVGPECIDQMRHTNNKVYLAWMEEAALAHSASLGWPTERYFEYGRGFVAAAHWIEYLRPTFEGEKLSMYTWVQTMETRTSLRRFALVRDRKLCMVGATRWAFVDTASGRSCPITEEVADAFPVVSPEDPVFETLGVNLQQTRDIPIR